jgi:glycerol-3-phosphate dehydrogenase
MLPLPPSGPIYDIAIIGGGINGCGIARDAAGRGLKVYLCEQNDLASGTSSWSSKLIHGGLRYLEHYKFRLVREALIEREILWKIAPHIIWPMRFVLPHHKGLRPAWLLRLGLFLYDHLGGRKLLPATAMLDLRTHETGKPLKPDYATAFEYSDCWVQDARLVLINAMDARERGADIETNTRFTSAERHSDHWLLTVKAKSGRQKQIKARSLVNASGPWVADVLTHGIRANSSAGVRLVQGSHIVVKQMFKHDLSYIFQNADGRIIFVIPYEQDFTLIGTTDLDYKGDPALVSASVEEIDYLCAAASEYFARAVTPADVVWTYSGVRPLYDDGASKTQEATRDYVLTLDAPSDYAPLLSVFGGKITTYRKLAEAVLAKMTLASSSVGQAAGWTADASLPGGDFPATGFSDLVEHMHQRFACIPLKTMERLLRTYGTRVDTLLDGVVTQADLGQIFGADLSEREVRYMIEQEWVTTADDILWRRSKLGLRFNAVEKAALAEFVTKQVQI